MSFPKLPCRPRVNHQASVLPSPFFPTSIPHLSSSLFGQQAPGWPPSKFAKYLWISGRIVAGKSTRAARTCFCMFLLFLSGLPSSAEVQGIPAFLLPSMTLTMDGDFPQLVFLSSPLSGLLDRCVSLPREICSFRAFPSLESSYTSWNFRKIAEFSPIFCLA